MGEWIDCLVECVGIDGISAPDNEPKKSNARTTSGGKNSTVRGGKTITARAGKTSAARGGKTSTARGGKAAAMKGNGATLEPKVTSGKAKPSTAAQTVEEEKEESASRGGGLKEG